MPCSWSRRLAAERKARVDKIKVQEAAQTKAALEAVGASAAEPAAETAKPDAAPEPKPKAKPAPIDESQL